MQRPTSARPLAYGRRTTAVQSPRGVYFALTPTIALMLLSIGVGLGSAAFCYSSEFGWVALLAWPPLIALAVAQAIFAMSITPELVFSETASTADRLLLAAVWIFGVGGSIFAVCAV